MTAGLAAALGVDPSLLLGNRDRADARVHAAMPTLSAVIAAYDVPDDGPVRPLAESRASMDEAVTWHPAAQYIRIARQLPPLIGELFAASTWRGPGKGPRPRTFWSPHFGPPTPWRTNTAPGTCPPVW